MQGNVVGLIELEPGPANAGFALDRPQDDSTLADTLRRLASDAGPVAVDAGDEDDASAAELFDAIEVPATSSRWPPSRSCLTRVSIDPESLLNDLREELRQLLERLLAAR